MCLLPALRKAYAEPGACLGWVRYILVLVSCVALPVMKDSQWHRVVPAMMCGHLSGLQVRVVTGSQYSLSTSVQAAAVHAATWGNLAVITAAKATMARSCPLRTSSEIRAAYMHEIGGDATGGALCRNGCVSGYSFGTHNSVTVSQGGQNPRTRCG